MNILFEDHRRKCQNTISENTPLCKLARALVLVDAAWVVTRCAGKAPAAASALNCCNTFLVQDIISCFEIHPTYHARPGLPASCSKPRRMKFQTLATTTRSKSKQVAAQQVTGLVFDLCELRFKRHGSCGLSLTANQCTYILCLHLPNRKSYSLLPTTYTGHIDLHTQKQICH